MSSVRAIPVLLLVLGISACHHYVPTVAPGLVAPGSQVRVRLTVAGAIRVSEATGEPRREIEGALVGAERDTLALAIRRLGVDASQVRPGFPMADTVLIARSDVEGIKEERISGKRTALLAGGVGVLVGVVVQQATKHEGGSQGSGKPAEPLKELVSALLRFLTSPSS